MTSHNSTDSSRMHAAVDRICSESFPLANNPDFPVGPIPLFKVRDLLAEAYRAATPTDSRSVDGIVDELLERLTPAEDPSGGIGIVLAALRPVLLDLTARAYRLGHEAGSHE